MFRTANIADYGTVLYSGYGLYPPKDIVDAVNWRFMTTFKLTDPRIARELHPLANFFEHYPLHIFFEQHPLLVFLFNSIPFILFHFLIFKLRRRWT